MPLPIPTTYLFAKTNSVIDQISIDIGLVPTASVWSLTDQISFTFPDELNSNDYDSLVGYMANDSYVFVSKTP